MKHFYCSCARSKHDKHRLRAVSLFFFTARSLRQLEQWSVSCEYTRPGADWILLRRSEKYSAKTISINNFSSERVDSKGLYGRWRLQVIGSWQDLLSYNLIKHRDDHKEQDNGQPETRIMKVTENYQNAQRIVFTKASALSLQTI